MIAPFLAAGSHAPAANANPIVAVDPSAIGSTADFEALYPSFVAPLDIFLCTQESGAPVNGGTGPLVFDTEAGTWLYRQAFTLGGVGMKASSNTSSWADSVATHGALGTADFTIFTVVEATLVPPSDRYVVSKRSGAGLFPGVSISLRNDGQILAQFDRGAGTTFENIDQGLDTDLIATWAIAATRRAGEVLVQIRKAGGAVQVSTPSADLNDFDDAAALWTLGEVTGNGLEGAIYRQFLRFAYGIPDAQFAALTAWMSP